MEKSRVRCALSTPPVGLQLDLIDCKRNPTLQLEKTNKTIKNQIWKIDSDSFLSHRSLCHPLEEEDGVQIFHPVFLTTRAP